MKSTKPHVVLITKDPKMGAAALPAYIGMLHRALEKNIPDGVDPNKFTAVVPSDMLRLVMADALVDEIVSVEISYERKKESWVSGMVPGYGGGAHLD